MVNGDVPDQDHSAIRVLILAETRCYREGLAQCLGRAPDIEVVGTASWREGSRAIREKRPDVLLADMDTPARIAAIRSIAGEGGEPKVLALAVSEADDEVIACAEAGVSGYVTREQSVDEAALAVRSVAEDGAPCSARIAAMLLRRVSHYSGPHHVARLTKRESEIVELIDAGLTNPEIARRLCIEVATVKNHVHNILEKLGVRRRADAAAFIRGDARAGSGSRRWRT